MRDGSFISTINHSDYQTSYKDVKINQLKTFGKDESSEEEDIDPFFARPPKTRVKKDRVINLFQLTIFDKLQFEYDDKKRKINK